jgi:hypothetical protein
MPRSRSVFVRRSPTSTAEIEVFQAWINILTADSSELQVLHPGVKTRTGYRPVMEDYARLFGCSSKPEEWPERLIRRLVVRVYNASISRLQHDVSLNTYQRTLFRTQDGSLGFGPRWIQLPTSLSCLPAK